MNVGQVNLGQNLPNRQKSESIKICAFWENFEKLRIKKNSCRRKCVCKRLKYRVDVSKLIDHCADSEKLRILKKIKKNK
jgi:hypothetical protein